MAGTRRGLQGREGGGGTVYGREWVGVAGMRDKGRWCVCDMRANKGCFTMIDEQTDIHCACHGICVFISLPKI